MVIALAGVAEVTVASKRTEEGMRMGDEIEAIRKEGPFTQQQVADRLGLKLATYLSYRRGYIQVTPNTLKKWANALDVPAAELAHRLGIELCLTIADASALRRELATLLPDAGAAQMEATVRELAKLPPHLRDQWMQMARINMRGIQADARES